MYFLIRRYQNVQDEEVSCLGQQMGKDDSLQGACAIENTKVNLTILRISTILLKPILVGVKITSCQTF